MSHFKSIRVNVKTNATHEVQTLQPKPVRCAPLAAVHVVAEGQNDLEGGTTGDE